MQKDNEPVNLNNDAYWLRMFAGMAMQELMDRHFNPIDIDNFGCRFSRVLFEESAEIAVSLLDEIKKHEAKNAAHSK